MRRLSGGVRSNRIEYDNIAYTCIQERRLPLNGKGFILKKRYAFLTVIIFFTVILTSITGQTEPDVPTWEYLTYQLADSTTPVVYPYSEALSALLEETCTDYSSEARLMTCHFNVLGGLGWELAGVNYGGLFLQATHASAFPTRRGW
jgi:hypothetical protein